MSNPYFKFKQFTIFHDRCAMKVTTDACLFGAWVANEMQDEKKIVQMMDIGTGTGLLSLMVAQKNNARIDAIEIDTEAASQAKENVMASPWKENIHIINSNILDMDSLSQYDIIISNPPFYENELSSPAKDKNKAHHSSELKLMQVMEVIKAQLKEEGKFYLLLPYKRNEEIDQVLKDFHFHVLKKILVAPSTKHQPFRILIKGSKSSNHKTEITNLTIRSEQEQYSNEFKSLLKDYYLYL